MADWQCHCWYAWKSPELGVWRHHIRFPTERTSTVTHRWPLSWSKGTAKITHTELRSPRENRSPTGNTCSIKYVVENEAEGNCLRFVVAARDPLPIINGKLWHCIEHSLFFWGKRILAASIGTSIFAINIYTFITPLPNCTGDIRNSAAIAPGQCSASAITRKWQVQSKPLSPAATHLLGRLPKRQTDGYSLTMAEAFSLLYS